MTAPVVNTVFVPGTTITHEWLNGVNDYVNESNPADHSSANVTYDPPFTNSVATTVEDKLAQTISVKDFGAVGDGSTDDTTAIQNAINATPSGATLYFPVGNYITTAALQINSPICIVGSSDISTILCIGCNGFEVNKCDLVKFENIEIAQAVRYTTTPNNYVGVYVDGDSVNRPEKHIYNNVYFDGFKTGIETNWLWSSLFNRVRTGFGQNGLIAHDLSANNVVTNCSFNGDSTGTGIFLDGDAEPSEGWMISDTLTYNNYIGIHGLAVTHVYVTNCILDYNFHQGILIQSSATNFASNWGITNNYIAMSGSSGIAGIHQFNTISNFQNRGNQISNNHILSYTGATCQYGILLEQTYSINNSVCNNSITNFSTGDISATYYPNAVSNNVCLSNITHNILVNSSVSNNIGTVYKSSAIMKSNIVGINVTSSDAAPTTGTWLRGDICWNIYPSAGGTPGWVCVTAGTPGTWKAMANLAS